MEPFFFFFFWAIFKASLRIVEMTKRLESDTHSFKENIIDPKKLYVCLALLPRKLLGLTVEHMVCDCHAKHAEVAGGCAGSARAGPANLAPLLVQIMLFSLYLRWST